MVGGGRGACARQMAKWIGIRSPPPYPPSPARRMESSNGTSGADKLIKPSMILAHGLVFLLGCRVEVFVANLPFSFFSFCLCLSLTQPWFSFCLSLAQPWFSFFLLWHNLDFLSFFFDTTLIFFLSFFGTTLIFFLSSLTQPWFSFFFFDTTLIFFLLLWHNLDFLSFFCLALW